MSVQFEIEAVVDIKERGVFVFARALKPETEFRVTQGSTLGGLALQNILEIPRAIDEHGKQRWDCFAFQLKERSSGHALTQALIVDLRPGDHLEFLPPWHSTDARLVEQYNREAPPDHALSGRKLRAIARRQDNDDVLFELLDDPPGYAVVHLTWAQRRLDSPLYPHTRFFTNWWDVFEQVIHPDNTNWE